ncbi:MAG: hypothetical protein WC618_04410 [Patescibacteria group bacterium]
MDFISLFPTIDWFVLFLFLAALILHLVFIKKSRLFIDIISVYTSFVLIIIVPMFFPTVHAWLGTHPLLRAGVFAGLVLLLHLLLSHSNIRDFSARVRPSDFATSFVYRVGIIGLFFTSILYFSPASIKDLLGPISHLLFMNFWALVVWFFIPLLFAFAYRFRTRRGWIE